MHRRNFLESISGALIGNTLLASGIESVQAATNRTRVLSTQVAARDESLWREVQNAFSVNRNIINLDNANVSPSPQNVVEAMIRYTWQEQEAPGYMLWQVLEPQLSVTRTALARSFGCEAEEIAIVRNTTEALHAVLLGVPLREGDEILMTTHDYWAMHDVIDERARRERITVKKISNVPMPPKSMNELLEMYERNITSKTRLLLVTHPVNLTGQLFPVKEICEMAHQKGIEVVVDGAQSFGLVDYKLSDLGCDYYGASLHKWFSAPLGTGLLYIRKDKIGKVRPLFPAANPLVKNFEETIYKFEDVGTKSVAAALSLSEALVFHNGVGAKRKEERMRYLTSYWAKRIGKLPNVRFYTSFEPEMSCGLATFEIKGIDSKEIKKHLWSKHRIFVQNAFSRWAKEVNGIRISPHLYTTIHELDYFCDAMEQIAQKGIPNSA